MDVLKKIFGFKAFTLVVFSLISISAVSETFQLGDLAPRGAPDGELNAADSMLLQKILLGDISSPTNDEILIGDVAPLNNPDGLLNTGDLVVQQRAILGLVDLSTVDILSLSAPILDTPVSPTTDNPYQITGTATNSSSIDVYVNGDLQKTVVSNTSSGVFSVEVYLYEGMNFIYAVENDGINTSPASNYVHVFYTNTIDRNNFPTNISSDLVLTEGASSEPYVISTKTYIGSGAKLILQPGVTLVFEGGGDYLKVNGELIIRGRESKKVLLTANDQSSGKGWDGIYVTENGTVTIDHTIIEYANSRKIWGPVGAYYFKQSAIFFAPGSAGRVSNTLIQHNRVGIEFRGESSVVIGPSNTITQNGNGIDLRAIDVSNPSPLINGNKIFDNDGVISNISATRLTPLAMLDARRNYWGSTNASEITSTVAASAYPPNPIIDISDYLDEYGQVVQVNNVLQGYISGDVTLLENTTYEVRGRLEVEVNATLNIPKGTTLKFTKSAGLTVYGHLNVQGATDNPVVFTSGKDNPVQSSWYTIDVLSGGNLSMDFAVVEFATQGVYFREGSNGTVINTLFRNNSEGIHITASSPIIGPNNTITQNGSGSGGGVYLSKGTIDPVPVIKNNKIFGNQRNNGVVVNIEKSRFNGGRDVTVDVRNNYWGTVSASEISKSISNCTLSNSSDPCIDYGGYLDVNGSVVGGESLIGVLQENLLLQTNTTYEVLGYFSIPDQSTLTVPSGVKLKFVSVYDGIDVLGDLVIAGTQTKPVIFTSGQVVPKEGVRSSPGDWDGIFVRGTGFLSMEYAVIQYSDRAIYFEDAASGIITNSVIEYAGTGVYFYNSSNVDISNSLFRFNGTALELLGSSSPLIGPGNTIKQNKYGIYLRQVSNLNPSPSVSGNYIFNNDTYNVNVNNFNGGNTVTLDLRGNYWGSDDPSVIALTMNQSSTSYPTIDFSEFILTAEVPPGTGSSPVAQELQVCPVVRVTDDDNFIDNYPDDDISWIGSNFSDVQEIEKGFNNARFIDKSIFQYLKMPSQEDWDAMTLQSQGLYLINSERQARGIKLYEGISPNVVAVAQNYADYVRVYNQPVGHYADGKTPLIRLNEDLDISNNSDAVIYLESVYGQFGGVTIGTDIEAVVDAVYRWIYMDKSGGNNWGHRKQILQIGLNENNGETYKEGLVGFGVSIGDYDPTFSVPSGVGAVVVINSFDPNSTWDNSTTQEVDTDNAQLCNDNITIFIDETSVSSVDKIIALEVSPSDIYLTPGATEQLQVIASYEYPIGPRDISSTVSFVADSLSVINIDAGNVTGLQNGSVTAVANINGVTSNRIVISVKDSADTSNLIGTFSENYLSYIPDNATLNQYDPKLFSIFTGIINNRVDAPLSDVIISIHGKPEYGSVKTDSNGKYIFAAPSGTQKLIYKKLGYLTLHRTVTASSNDWAVADDAMMLRVDTKQTEIDLTSTTPQTHVSTEVSDSFGSRSTTLVFNGITSATILSLDGSQRQLSEFFVRATEYELPQSMPAELPENSAFTYCAELQIPNIRDDESVIFDNDVVMYVDNFLGFGVGEIVPIGYYDRQIGDWEASDNGIVVKLLDTDGDGLVDGLDISGDDVPEDLNQNGDTSDEVVGIESYTPGKTYWRGSFNHFTPFDFNWPYQPVAGAIGRGGFIVENSNEDKNKDDLVCTGSYVKPETQSFHEDIEIIGTNLLLHYSSQRTEGYKHKFNVVVSEDTIPNSMLEMLVKLEIGGNVFEQSFSPEANKDAEIIWDGKDPAGNRIKGAVNGVLSIGYRYSVQYVSAGIANTPLQFGAYQRAWAKVGIPVGIRGGRDDFITWSTRPVSVQNTHQNQIAEGWSISNHHHKSPIGQIYLGSGDVIDADKTSLIRKTGVTTSVYLGDDGTYKKGGSNLDYVANRDGNIVDTVTGLEWQYIKNPQKYTQFATATGYCENAYFTDDRDGWRLPSNKEIIYTVDKSEKKHDLTVFNLSSIDNIWHQSNNNPEEKFLPVYCVRGEYLDSRYVENLKRNNTLEVVIDELNGLMWQDDTGTIASKYNWENSIDHCEDLSQAGYDDWRLPNINELAYTLPNTVFLNKTDYVGETWGPTSPGRVPYWSSTPYSGFNGYAWAMESHGGSSPVFSTSDLYNVRCVRDNIGLVSNPYQFDSEGQHIETVDLDTGKSLETFGYSNGILRSITDRFGTNISITGDPVEDGYYRITTVDGYDTTVYIDDENEVTSIRYNDNSGYTFIYTDGALLETKTEPNGNIFTHVFDPVDGRVVQTSDQESGVWDFFSNTIGNNTTLYGYNTAELNIYQTQRTILESGDVDKVTTLFDGTELTDIRQADDLKQTLQSCLATTEIDKVIDSKTSQPIPSVVTITQPSGLQKITNINKSYGEEGSDFTKQTITTSVNGKPDSSVFTDTNTGVTLITSSEGRTSSLTIDTDTLLLKSRHTPGLLDTVYGYDGRGRKKTITTGTRTTTFFYNSLSKGDIAYIRADDGIETHFDYDALGRIKTIDYPGSVSVKNEYDENGNLEKRIVPTSAEHKFSYNNVNKVKTETRPKESGVTNITVFEYDDESKLKRVTLPSQKVITNTYVDGLLDSVVRAEGTIDYDYTCNEKVEKISEGIESISYNYDGDLLDDITYAGVLSAFIDFEYDPEFNISNLRYAGDNTDLDYDNDGLLIGIHGYTIDRNDENGFPEMLGDSTLQQIRSYNDYGEIEAVTTKVNLKDTYDYTVIYNDLGKIVTKSETLDDGSVNSFVYKYDDRRRLDTVTKNGVLIEDYDYDANGNREQQTNTLRSIVAQNASYNLGDQLETNGAATYDYNRDGQLKEKLIGSDTTTYQYSTQGRLLQVQTPSKLIEYRHNAIGNRVQKKVDGIITEQYLWLDKTTLLAIYDKDDVLIQRYHYTDGNTPNSFTQSGQTYYIVTDHLGSPRVITDSSGGIVKKLDYDSFGNLIFDSNPGFRLPFGFAGGLYDADTGLTRFGFRDYDADVGRWTARDPIGFGGGDTNLYGYVLNDPINIIDQTGESPVIVVGVAAAVSFVAGGAISAANGGSFLEGGASAAAGTIVAGAIAVASANSGIAILAGAVVSILSNALFSADVAYDVLDPDANVNKACKAK